MPGEPGTVAEILRHQAQLRGDHPLLVCDDHRLSYGEADRRSAELARGLIALGAGKGTHVGLLYPNGRDFVLGMLAAARIGAVVVPFSTFATARELREQLVHGDVSILLSAASFRSHDYVHRLTQILEDVAFDGDEPLFCTAAPQLRHIVIGSALSDRADTVDPALLRAMEEDVDGSDVLAIVYTSGSTSVPKGVVHTHAALLGHQRNLNAIRGLSAEDKLFCNSPFGSAVAFGLLAWVFTLVVGDGSLNAIRGLSSATTGCSAIRHSSGSAGWRSACWPRWSPDQHWCAPTPVTPGDARPARSRKADHDQWFRGRHRAPGRPPEIRGRDLSSMRRGNLYPIMAPETRPADPELRHNMLGMTEAGSVLLISPDESDQPERRRGSYGKPAPGFDTMIVDPDTTRRSRAAR